MANIIYHKIDRIAELNDKKYDMDKS